jgi:dynein heavy chain, axonemal
MNIKISQLNATFDYGFEYQGNNGRLIITPLTDRAYMTLTNALNMFRGGAPQGPAGTGKTETVKDLGKNLAFYVVIQNCAPEMEPEGLGNTF